MDTIDREGGVLLVSYETLRIHLARLLQVPADAESMEAPFETPHWQALLQFCTVLQTLHLQ